MLNHYKHFAKKGMLIIAGFGLLMALSGCSTSDFQTLDKAEAKTEAAATGMTTIDLQIENQLVTTGLTAEQLKLANYMKAVAYKGDYSFDKKKDQAVSQSWINLGGIGFDFTYYKDQDKQFIRYPVLKKYIDLNALVKPKQQRLNLSQETQAALAEVWRRLYTEDSVKKADKTFVATAEGDVKATRFDISASGDAVKAAILESQKLILADDAVKAQLEALKVQAAKSGESVHVVGLPENAQLKDFQLSAYVDADGYLIKEVVVMGLSMPDSLNGFWQGTSFQMTTTYSKLNQGLQLDIPQVTAADMMSEEEMQRDMPAAFSDLVK